MGEDTNALLQKIYSCILDMQKEIRDLRREMNEKIRESEERMKAYVDEKIRESEERMKAYVDEKTELLEERMKAYTDKKVDFLAGKLQATEGQLKFDMNDSIETLRFILEDEMDHLEVTVKRPEKLSIAEEQAVYHVQE